MIFIVLVPLTVSLFLLIMSVAAFVRRGGSWEVLPAIVIFLAICGYLCFSLIRVIKAKGRLVVFPQDGDTEENPLRKSFVGGIVFGVYALLFGLGAFMFSNVSAKYWTGTVCFIAGLSLLLSLIVQIRSKRMTRSSTFSKDPKGEQAINWHRNVRNLVLMSSFGLAALSFWFYNYGGGANFFSRWDLIGFLFLLIANMSFFIWRETDPYSSRDEKT